MSMLIGTGGISMPLRLTGVGLKVTPFTCKSVVWLGGVPTRIEYPEKVKDGIRAFARFPSVAMKEIPEFRRDTSPGINPKIKMLIMRTSSTDTTAPPSSFQRRRRSRIIGVTPVATIAAGIARLSNYRSNLVLQR